MVERFTALFYVTMSRNRVGTLPANACTVSHPSRKAHSTHGVRYFPFLEVDYIIMMFPMRLHNMGKHNTLFNFDKWEWKARAKERVLPTGTVQNKSRHSPYTLQDSQRQCCKRNV